MDNYIVPQIDISIDSENHSWTDYELDGTILFAYNQFSKKLVTGAPLRNEFYKMFGVEYDEFLKYIKQWFEVTYKLKVSECI